MAASPGLGPAGAEAVAASAVISHSRSGKDRGPYCAIGPAGEYVGNPFGSSRSCICTATGGFDISQTPAYSATSSPGSRRRLVRGLAGCGRQRGRRGLHAGRDVIDRNSERFRRLPTRGRVPGARRGSVTARLAALGVGRLERRGFSSGPRSRSVLTVHGRRGSAPLSTVAILSCSRSRDLERRVRLGR